MRVGARTGGTKCSLYPSIHSPTAAACTQDFSPSQAITLTFFLTADEILTESVSALCCRGGERKGVAMEKKRDSMCLSEWRWRVSVWLVNPV